MTFIKGEEAIDEHFQEFALTIIHCQQVKGFSLVPENFSFLPHILQQRSMCGCFSLLFFFKRILLFVAAAIPSRQAPETR
jgi:hypothetical protein